MTMKNPVPKTRKPKQPSPLSAPESEIRAQIKEYLQWKGWFVFYHLQGLGSYPGLPDLQAVKNGQALYIEVKKAGGRQSARQKKFQQDVERAGGIYLLARSVDDIKTQ